jgi:hypothetical protein
VQHLNPLWFFLGAIAIIVFAAILAELLPERSQP